MIRFNADEVFEMAEQIERNGAKFYRKAAVGAGGRGAASMLLELAAMEDDHERTFAAMRAQLKAGEKVETLGDPDAEGPKYLRALVEGKVFNPSDDPSARLTGKESLAQILRTAIGLEKDSIVFYVGMKDMVPSEGGKSRLDEIVAQEIGHIATLSGKLHAVA